MDLSTDYLGFRLPHPLMVGASPLGDDLDMVRRLEDAGAAAIVLHSLFEEELRAEASATVESADAGTHSFGEALTYLPSPPEAVMGPHQYLEHIGRAKAAVEIPVIASLNGSTPGGWLDYAKQLAQAGADGIELNLYYVASDPDEDSRTIECQAVRMLRGVKEAVTIPVAVKLSPFYTAFAHFAGKLDEAGADGLVLFNRYFEPDIDVEALAAVSQLRLSEPAELLLRLRWLAILSGRLGASLAVTGGVHTAGDALKAVLCGAHAVQMVSALLNHGPEHLARVRQELADWFEENEYESLRQAQGSMNLLRCPDPQAFERVNYLRQLRTWVG